MKLIFLAVLWILAAAPTLAQAAEVAAYVKSTHVHSVDYAEASTLFGSRDIPALLRILRSRGEEEHWGNAALVLGAIGNRRVIAPLIDLAKGGSGKISTDHQRAKSAALIGLGYALNKTPDQAGMDFLTRGLSESNWSRLRWTSALYPDAAELRRQMSTLCLLGLGLTGKPEAARALESFTPADDSQRATLEDAKRMHSIVAAKGIAEFYRLELQGAQRSE